jgi:hypothetical protein
MSTIDPMAINGPCLDRVTVLITPGHRQMLQYLAKRQRRTLNSVVRVAIERVYEVERRSEETSVGRARGGSSVVGRSG